MWRKNDLNKFSEISAGDVDSGNYAKIDTTGWLQFQGTATQWEDVDFPIIIRTTGANIPSLATLKGNLMAPQWQVNDLNMCEGKEFTHKWKEGSEIHWHVHMITNGLNTTARYVKWEIEYCWANVNGQLSDIQINTFEYEIPANTPDRTMHLVSISTYIPSGGKIAGHMYPRLRRIASSGTAPTLDPFCTMLQMHIEIDSLGSREIASK